MKEIFDFQVGRLLIIVVLSFITLNSISTTISSENIIFRHLLPWTGTWLIFVATADIKLYNVVKSNIGLSRPYWYFIAAIFGILAQPTYLSKSIFSAEFSEFFIAALVSMAVAFSEELTFRGLAYSTIKSNTILKIAFSAVIFSAAHGLSLRLTYLVFVFVVGILIGALRSSSKSILPGVLAHFIHNLGAYIITP